MQRYTVWCRATHGHEPMKDDSGMFVLYSDVERLQAEKEVLRKALKFYADKQHIRYGALEAHGRDAGWPELLPPEDGEVARKALSATGEGK